MFNSSIGCRVAVVLLVWTASARATMTFTLDSATSDNSGAGGSLFTTQNSTDPNHIHFSSQLGPLTGAQWTTSLAVQHYAGSLTGTSGFFTARLITIESLHADYTGGTVTVQNLQTNSGALTGAALFNTPTTIASGTTLSQSFQSSTSTVGAQPGSTWEHYIFVKWSGFSPTDTLTFTVPSADVVVAPEPACGMLLMIGATSLLTRRARRIPAAR